MVVFVGTIDGQVYALNEHTGANLWQRSVCGGIYSSPAVAYGKVFAGCYDGKIYAFNEMNGVVIWTFQTGGPIQTFSLERC